VQTDWSQPVAFSESTLRAREAAGAARIRDDAVVPEGEGKWSGRTFAEAQSVVYELKPLEVTAPPPEATVAAEKVAKQLGWSVMLSDPPNGQLEAVNYSFWYGLASDIAVRIQPAGQGSRIDVRSTSRVADGDGGANAGRIQEFLNELAFALR
jgi:fatty-acyl-CoA synthase